MLKRHPWIVAIILALLCANCTTRSTYTAYRDVVAKIYYDAWDISQLPEKPGLVKTEVVIARSGKVVSARILEGSGDKAADASVQKTLATVKSIRPFPVEAKENQRIYKIHFNLHHKRSQNHK